eukprot:Skav233115  [mRNA]  locus=scaffold1342:331198:332816:- [translate_table: standard]
MQQRGERRWLEEREDLIRSSRVLLVIASQAMERCHDSRVFRRLERQDSLENAAVLQDCLWAWQWGVPVLPVRRVGDDQVPKELRKKLRFLYSLKMGLPEVGLGTNRKDFFFKISSALAAGIRMGRSKKRKKLPRNVWAAELKMKQWPLLAEYFLRAVKHLQRAKAIIWQRDAKDLVSTDRQMTALNEKLPCLTSHEARGNLGNQKASEGL